MNTTFVPTPYIHASIKRRKNTWYSMTDGPWDNRLIWMSNAMKRWNYPWQAGYLDDVYINHTVSNALLTTAVNNMRVAGTWNWWNISATVATHIYGDLQVTGTVNMTAPLANSNLYLYGVNNYVVNFIRGTGTVWYMKPDTQPVAIMDYYNLRILKYGTKYLQADCLVYNNLTMGDSFSFQGNAVLALGNYNLAVTGNTEFPGSVEGVICKMTKTGAGTVLFNGWLFAGNCGNAPGSVCIDFTGGNPTVELRNGIYWQNAVQTMIKTGTSPWSFTTNNQAIEGSGGTAYFDSQILVVGAITLTNNGMASSIFIYQPINGTVPGSAFVNKGVVYFGTLAAVSSMTTGTFDRLTYPNVLGYAFAGPYTLEFTTYQGVYIASTGVRTLAGNTTLSYVLNVFPGAYLECSTYNLSVGNITTISGTFSKTGAGSIVFGNRVDFNNVGTLSLTGNPTVEMKGGWNFVTNGAVAFNQGTGLWKFSTNNQTWASGTILGWTATTLISGAITVTKTGGFGWITGSIDGDNAASTFDNRGTTVYQNATAPMLTGILQTNAAANTFNYGGGNQDVKGGTYYNIVFSGSGIKRLLGNVVINATGGGSQSTTGTATVDLNGFTITTI